MSDVTEQVDTLLGRPFSDVDGVDFEIAIAPALGGKWHLRLDRIEPTDRDEPRSRPRETRSRELVGRSCAELVDAAAVAIAMSIRSSMSGDDAQTGEPADTGPRATGSQAPPDPSPVNISSPQPSPPTANLAAPRGSLALAFVMDTGALPGTAPGGAIEGALDGGSLRLIGLGALFASQTARVGTVGGDFRLAFGAALGCVTHGLGRIAVMGCGGMEIGRLTGEGVGLDRPRLGSALWLAPRADIGLAVPVATNLRVIVRAGAVAPLSRPVFLADSMVRVYQASRVSARTTLGMEIGF